MKTVKLLVAQATMKASIYVNVETLKTIKNVFLKVLCVN
jgi:hypothetical protein